MAVKSEDVKGFSAKDVINPGGESYWVEGFLTKIYKYDGVMKKPPIFGSAFGSTARYYNQLKSRERSLFQLWKYAHAKYVLCGRPLWEV